MGLLESGRLDKTRKDMGPHRKAQGNYRKACERNKDSLQTTGLTSESVKSGSCVIILVRKREAAKTCNTTTRHEKERQQEERLQRRQKVSEQRFNHNENRAANKIKK
jgi:hypothetical protein